MVQPRDSVVRLRGHVGRAARRLDALEAAGACGSAACDDPRARDLGRRHALQRGGVARRALPPHGLVARRHRQAVRDHLRGRRVDRRHVRRARASPRRRRARAGRPLPPELRPASGHARGPREGAGRRRRDDGRRPPERARGHPEARGGGGRRAPTWRAGGVSRAATRGAGRFPRSSSTACCAASRESPSPTSAAPSTRTAATRSRRCSARSASRSSRRRSCSRGGKRRRGRRPARGTARLVPLLAAAADAAGAPRARGLLAAADPVDRRDARHRLLARRVRARRLRHCVLDRRGRLPGTAVRRRRDRVRARHPGLHPRPRRRVSRQNPARRGRPASLHDREGSCEQARSRHGRRGLHLVERRPAPARRDAARGRVARRAHVRGQHREPRRRDVARAALLRARATSATPSSCARSWRAWT